MTCEKSNIIDYYPTGELEVTVSAEFCILYLSVFLKLVSSFDSLGTELEIDTDGKLYKWQVCRCICYLMCNNLVLIPIY